MHSHHHDHDHDVEQRTGGLESRPPVEAVLLRAAASGRPDVLGRAGMLGVQRVAGNRATAGLMEPDLGVLSSGGQSLDEPVRQDMETRMGHDFSGVRVHTGDAADTSARSVQAHAYTVGSNIVFQRGAYDPGSAAGQQLIAHELTHVVQQRTGPVDGTPAGGGVRVSDPSDRFERDAASNAERVMAMPAAPAAPVQAAAAPVQRNTDDGAVQTSADPTLLAVQREGEEEEEVQASHDESLPAPAVQREEEQEEEA